MNFPVTLTPDKVDGGFVVTFPDIPEAVTQGETREEALKMAREALEAALEFYFEDRRAVPAPSRATPGGDMVAIPAGLSAKVLLLNKTLAQNLRPADPSRRISC